MKFKQCLPLTYKLVEWEYSVPTEFSATHSYLPWSFSTLSLIFNDPKIKKQNNYKLSKVNRDTKRRLNLNTLSLFFFLTRKYVDLKCFINNSAYVTLKNKINVSRKWASFIYIKKLKDLKPNNNGTTYNINDAKLKRRKLNGKKPK